MHLFDRVHGFFWESMTENNCNAYLIDGPEKILIDPGHAHLFHHVTHGLEALGLREADMNLVICTHAHPDHMEAARFFKENKALLAVNDTEWQAVKDMESYLAVFGVNYDAVEPDLFLKQGDLVVGPTNFQVFVTPGHTPGSICIYWPDHKALFTGDLVFKEGCGRTDLPGGNSDMIKQSITQMAGLDVEWILPGHGEIVSGKEAVKATFQALKEMFSYI